MALDLTGGRRGLAALGQVRDALVRHLLAVDVEIDPVTELRDAKLTWYVGLDANATRIGEMRFGTAMSSIRLRAASWSASTV